MKASISQIKRNTAFDVIGIGSALLDITVEVDDSFLVNLGLRKGEMHLVDEAKSRDILAGLQGRTLTVSPGGSAANTISGIANLNGRGVFLGTVGRDVHGDMYINKSEETGVKTMIGRHDRLTGNAIIFVTPDHERTFAVHLGAALEFGIKDVDEESIRKSSIIHFEGYLFELPELRKACYHALEIAQENGVIVSIDLSDPALITRIRGTFADVLEKYAHIVFANEHEAKEFTGEEGAAAAERFSEFCEFSVVKLGGEGSIIKHNNEIFRIPARRTSLINTNGAGDIYASGVLYGIAGGFSPVECGELGSYAASLVIAQVGARLESKIDASEVLKK